jgi:chromosome partitioning protein
MKIVAIANQKGGVGKTTTAVNLSAGLAMRGHPSLLIDLDPQANATSGLGLEAEAEETIYPALVGDAAASRTVRPTRIEGLSAIPAATDLAGAEIELARSGNHLVRLREVLGEIRSAHRFEYCVLDTPPSLGVLMTGALAAADEILIPLQCEWFGLEGLAKIVGVFEELRSSGINPNVQIEGILMTMFDGRTKLARQVVEEVGNYFPDQLYRTLIPRSVRLGEAPSHGLTIFEHAPTGTAARAYSAFVDEFLARRSAAGPQLA